MVTHRKISIMPCTGYSSTCTNEQLCMYVLNTEHVCLCETPLCTCNAEDKYVQVPLKAKDTTVSAPVTTGALVVCGTDPVRTSQVEHATFEDNRIWWWTRGDLATNWTFEHNHPTRSGGHTMNVWLDDDWSAEEARSKYEYKYVERCGHCSKETNTPLLVCTECTMMVCKSCVEAKTGVTIVADEDK